MCCPASQRVQNVEPFSDVCAPSEHSEQITCPPCLEYQLVGHNLHPTSDELIPFSVPYIPGGQSTQAVDEVAPSAELKNPALHSRQSFGFVSFSSLEYLPFSQRLQLLKPEP